MANYAPMKVLGELGRGSFGVVYLVQHKDTKEEFAVKTIEFRRRSEEDKKKEKEEADLLWRINHDHVVSYVNSYDHDGALFIVTEYCAGKDLHHYLYKTSDDLLPEDLVLSWTVQIAYALEYLHAKNILHRDLKPQNIYLTSEADVRVGDLGLARVLDKIDTKTDSIVGTPAYMSPECWRGKPYNRKTDVWSLGCIVYEMSHRRRKEGHDYTCICLSFFKSIVPKGMFRCSKEMENLILLFTQREYKKRPEAKEIVQQKFVADFLKKGKCKPADVIRSTNAKPVDSSTTQLRELNARSIKNSDVQIPEDILAAYRCRKSGERDMVDAGMDVTDAGGMTDLQPGLFIIYSLLMKQFQDVEANATSPQLTDEEKKDPATVRKHFQKLLPELKSLYEQALTADVWQKVNSLFSSTEDPEELRTNLVSIVPTEEYADKLLLLNAMERGCTEEEEEMD